MITPTTRPGTAIAASPMTSAESMPPLNPTTIPRALASATRAFIHSARSLAVVIMPARRLRFGTLDDAQERVDERGIELVPTLPVDFRNGIVDRPRVFVRPLLRQRVEDVRHRDHAAGEGDRVLRHADIAIAVPAFVMAESDFFSESQDRESAAGEDACPDRRVGLDEFEFRRGEFPQLE